MTDKLKVHKYAPTFSDCSADVDTLLEDKSSSKSSGLDYNAKKIEDISG